MDGTIPDFLKRLQNKLTYYIYKTVNDDEANKYAEQKQKQQQKPKQQRKPKPKPKPKQKRKPQRKPMRQQSTTKMGLGLRL